MPVIRVDDEVMSELKKRAIELGLVFEPPNSTLRAILISERKDQKETPVSNEIELQLNESSRKYSLIPLPKDKRYFFPGFKVNFDLITDAGVSSTRVTSGPKGTPIGDHSSGNYIQGELKQWFEKHPELTSGDKIRIQVLNPGKTFKLLLTDKK
jgi:hypothetical protein